ncbi:MAG TPA: cytochrome ubiquinol oxidase subunit I [Candidatus Krumholzibacteria bacterium]|nr:cytochrome ubiquinol oxidase subunit I [Candidatus Krumholzibacteria bacterium]
MADALVWHRLQFAFTAVYHYIFPQLTMGLAFLIVIMKWRSLRGDERWNDAARFWIRIFGLNFAVGVVTGIPMEFQFGTNWARFTSYAGKVVGHTLGMEGLLAFFLESSFIAILVWGERRVSRRVHYLAAIALWVGSWLSGYFIVTTNAFLQRPVGYEFAADGTLRLGDFGAFITNPWAIAQYAHTIMASVVTASFVVAATGAYYLLRGEHLETARRFVRLGVIVGAASSLLVAFPTGDMQAKLVARYQPVSLAAMEGRFESGPMAEITLIGQPNVPGRRLDNPVQVPGALSFLAYGTFHSDVAGLNEFPEQDWPDNIELLYYAFHVMAGLGTIMIGVMLVALLLAWRHRLAGTRWMLWLLMLMFPAPYIANTAGWLTTELGRQPWVVYGLLRTVDASSTLVHSGTALFTLIGFCGMYFVLGVLFLFLVAREVVHGPVPAAEGGHG